MAGAKGVWDGAWPGRGAVVVEGRRNGGSSYNATSGLGILDAIDND